MGSLCFTLFTGLIFVSFIISGALLAISKHVTITSCTLFNKTNISYSCSGKIDKISGTYECGPTPNYELIYYVIPFGTNISSKICRYSRPECNCCYNSSPNYMECTAVVAKIPSNDCYPLIVSDLTSYNSMMLGTIFDCLVDNSFHVYSTDGYVPNTIIWIIFLLFPLYMIAFSCYLVLKIYSKKETSENTNLLATSKYYN